MKKKYYNNLQDLRTRINSYKSISSNDITKLIARRRLLQKKETMVSKIVPINQLKDWKFDKKIFHKSKQFFSVEGVKVNKARREVGGIPRTPTYIVAELIPREVDARPQSLGAGARECECGAGEQEQNAGTRLGPPGASRNEASLEASWGRSRTPERLVRLRVSK